MLQKPAFCGVAGEGEGGAEMLAGELGPAGARFKFAERGMVKGIAGETLRIGDGANLFEPALGTFMLRDGDGAVERHDRRRANGRQSVVKRNDHSPIRIL